MRARVMSAAVVLALSGGAWAQVTGHTADLTRWGLSDGAIGVVGCTIEDFEDAALEPGLSVSWTSDGGNSGPYTTLPNTFDPTTDDAFGSAFVGGPWSGSRCLINTRTNRPFTYVNGANWGNTILTFDPPVRFVGFSLHQSEVSPVLWVNGTARGTLNSVAGTPQSGTRNGYIILKAAGAETISTIMLDNQGGDGFTIDRLAYSTTLGTAVTVENVPPALWGADDATLGLGGAVIEDFEDVTLIPGLRIGVESPNGGYSPTPTLPRAFDPVQDDAFGNGFDVGVWDGTRCLINTRSNNTFHYGDVGSWGDVLLEIDPPMNVVGFSMQEINQPTRLIINGRDVGELRALGGGPLDGRQGYYKVTTDDPARISSLRLGNGRAVFGDGLTIDHLALLRTCPADFNQDGNADQDDVTYLINVIGGGENPSGRDPDFNEDGNVDQDDIAALINVVGGGACP